MRASDHIKLLIWSFAPELLECNRNTVVLKKKKKKCKCKMQATLYKKRGEAEGEENRGVVGEAH